MAYLKRKDKMLFIFDLNGVLGYVNTKDKGVDTFAEFYNRKPDSEGKHNFYLCF